MKAKYQSGMKAVNSAYVILGSVNLAASNAVADGYVTNNNILLSVTSIDAAIRLLKFAHSELTGAQSINQSIPLCGSCK